MKDDAVLACIHSELCKIKFVSNSIHYNDIVFAIQDRLDISDSEDTISKKIYDVLFFYFSGSHLNKNLINIKDYLLFARKIKLTIEKPDGIVGDLLVQLTDLESQIQEKQTELNVLTDSKFKLIKQLHSACAHKEFVQKQLYHEDEYGKTLVGNMERECLICGLREEAESQTPWINEPGTYKFVYIIGEPTKSPKIKLNQ